MSKTYGALALVAMAALAGCSKPAPEMPATEATDEAPAPVPTPRATPAMAPAASPTVAAVRPPPAPVIPPEVQMQDDADATGMTAQVTRDDPPTNETAPQ